MQNHNMVQTERKELVEIICDKCGRVATSKDITEWQEYLNIDFMGGYGSVFGDENVVTCDLCSHCLHELIGNFCYINNVKQK